MYVVHTVSKIGILKNIIKRASLFDSYVKGTLPQNTDYNTPKPFTITWTPQQYSSYEVIIEIQSTGNTDMCNNQGISASASTTFNIGNDNDNDGYYDLGGDCNDNNPLINPEAQEICDGINNDCDNEIDEGCNCYPLI